MASPLIIATLAAALSGLGPQGAPEGMVMRVSGDCSAAASQVVAQTGGQLLSAVPDGGGSCVVTVLVPGNGSERPRKVTVRVPM